MFRHSASDRRNGIVLLGRVVRVLFGVRIQESHDSLPLVVTDQMLIRSCDDQHKNRSEDRRDHHRAENDLIGESCTVIQNTEDHKDRDRIFQVRLACHEEQGQRDEEQRLQNKTGFVQFILMIHEIFGEKDHEENLGELHRLKTEAENGDPPRRSACIRPDKENEKEQDNVRDIDDVIEVHDPGKVRERQDDHHGHTKQNAAQLAGLQSRFCRPYQKDAERRECTEPQDQSEIIVF